MKLSTPFAGLLLVTALASCGTEGPEPKPSLSAKPTVLDITGLANGDAPEIAWAKGALLNGDPAKDILQKNVDQFARTKQLLVMRDVEGNVFAYAPEGPKGTEPIGTATGRLAVNAERNMVAWVEPDGSPTVLQEGHAKPVTLPKPDGVEGGDAVAVLGSDCFNGPETVEGAGCSVYLRVHDEEPRSFVASNHGFVESADDEIPHLADADDHGIVGWTETFGMETCSKYVERGTAEGEGNSWKTCKHMPLSFSPDGKRVLATHEIGFEGLGTGELTILDRATGKSKLTLRNNEKSQAFIVDMTWEDDDHVLAVAFQQGKWAIIRVGVDGAMELAVKPAAGEDTDIPFKLAVQP